MTMEFDPIQEEKRQKRFLKLDLMDPDFRSNADNWNKEELKARLAEIATLEQLNQDLLKIDDNVNDLKAKVADAKAPYADTTKTHKLKIEYLVKVASDKGWNG